jgi:hypothetical protein
MPPAKKNDEFGQISAAKTSAPNFDLDTGDIIDELKRWKKLCSFSVTKAEGDALSIKFESLPKDLRKFAEEIYSSCPDVVDQGTGCIAETIEALEEAGEEIPARIKKLAEGLDPEADDFGLRVLERELKQTKALKLWWD